MSESDSLSVEEKGKAMSSTTTDISRSDEGQPTADLSGLPTFTIDGDGVFSSTYPSNKAMYELTHKLDGSDNGYIIGLTRVERENIRGEKGKIRVKTRTRHLYDVTRSPFWPHDCRIEGRRKGSHKEAHLRRALTTSGVGLGVSGSGTPSLSARPPLGSMLRFETSDALQWRDGGGRIIALEKKRKWTEDGKEATKPVLEVKERLDDTFLDFLVVAWCTRNWKEAKAVTTKPMTWEDCRYRLLLVVGFREC